VELKEAWERFKRSKASVLGLSIIAPLIFIGIFAPVLVPYHPKVVVEGKSLLEPSPQHLLGTDIVGRDIFSWVLWGCRTSLLVGIGAVIIELVIGLTIGALAGYYGGWIDNILMRITETMLALPAMVLIIVAAAMFKVRSLFVITVIMGAIGWPWLARVVRGEFLILKDLAHVEAAEAMGAKNFRIIFKHILPNIIAPLLVLITLDIPSYILWESTITFLGLGDPTSVSWGLMLNFGRNFIRRAWWITTFPGLAIFISTLGFNLLGDGLRDALDIRM
jgi:ABC-type dipeptide/oligopeptide/nickel transport system permease subunit